ncbi:hypothetical protein EGW08_007792 [Elysia chlorotica]|uniref:C-type lectin domain-containing protein n=1 Tax=Elysia chlorotica TaxID=188477 RepID=A0A433TSB4_ELYCH|nr:hypothetical protein EGW08_007792 [Elysia chlorotica]
MSYIVSFYNYVSWIYCLLLTDVFLGVGSKCPNEWTYYSGSKSCMRVFEKGKTWDDARVQCRKYGGDLVINAYGEKTKKISELGQGTLQKTFWVGLNDKKVEGLFEWVDGTPLIVMTILLVRVVGRSAVNIALGQAGSATKLLEFARAAVILAT